MIRFILNKVTRGPIGWECVKMLLKLKYRVDKSLYGRWIVKFNFLHSSNPEEFKSEERLRVGCWTLVAHCYCELLDHLLSWNS